MASTQYRSQQPTLASMLSGQGVGDAPPPPTVLSNDQMPTEGNYAALEQAAFAPDPQMSNPGISWTQRIGATLANALGAYAAVRSHTSPPRDFLAELEAANAADNSDKYKAQLRSTQQGREKAQYLLNRNLNASERKMEIRRQENAAKSAADAIAARQIADDERAAVAHAADVALKEKQRIEDQNFEIKLENLRYAHRDPSLKADEKLAKKTEKDQENFSKGSAIGIILRDGDPKHNVKSIQEQLATGIDPKALAGQLRQRFEEELDAEGVFGHGRDLARDSFNSKVIRALMSPQAPAAPQ